MLLNDSKNKIVINKLVVRLDDLSQQLIHMKINNFGYRERINLERILFLLAKLIVKEKCNVNLSAFTMESLEQTIENNHGDYSILHRILCKLYEIKLAAKKLSSSNAYVRIDAISSFSGEIEKPFLAICRSIKSIRQDITDIMRESNN